MIRSLSDRLSWTCLVDVGLACTIELILEKLANRKLIVVYPGLSTVSDGEWEAATCVTDCPAPGTSYTSKDKI